MNEQSIRKSPIKRALPRRWITLLMLVVFTHVAALLMNQPAAYWLDHQYRLIDIPFGSLLSAGPWWFLLLASIYLIALYVLLTRTRTATALFLSATLFMVHVFALFWIIYCGFRAIFEANNSLTCQAFQYSPLAIFLIIFALALVVERLPEGVLHWARKLALPAALLWILLMGFGIFRAAVPAKSVWRPLAPAHSPGPRSMAAIAYDTKRQRAVLFGGVTVWNGTQWVYDNTTWEWDGQDWSKIDSPIAPAGRILHAMAYDEQREKVILYGGFNTSGTLADLWEWDGKTWHRLCPVCNPAARSSHKMIYDQERQRIVIYGGNDGETGYAQAWIWNSQNWDFFPFESSAPALYDAPIVYDTNRRQVVAFIGGEWGGTWIWKGSSWRKLDVQVEPAVRDSAVLIYDPVGDRSILFGGKTASQSYFNDTWIFDGARWMKINTPTAPPQRYRAVAFYDPVRNSVILFGGEKLNAPYGDMWELQLSDADRE